ncbi:AUGMIN subunit [Trifolium repens]|nr:AUGMIN subunit [Trifolium repens]
MELEATLAYKIEATDLQRQLRHLQSQFDMLSSQASTLTQGSLSGRNLQMNAVLGRIASTSEELAHYHSGDEDELSQWFAKQLDTGPFRLVAEEGKSKCSYNKAFS